MKLLSKTIWYISFILWLIYLEGDDSEIMVIDRANFKWKSTKKKEEEKKENNEEAEVAENSNKNDIIEVPFNLTNLCLNLKKVSDKFSYHMLVDR